MGIRVQAEQGMDNLPFTYIARQIQVPEQRRHRDAE